MLQKDAPREHLNLIRRVERINKEAAIYIKSRLKKYVKGDGSYTTSNSLNGTFVFSNTTQGFAYWKAIMIQLGEW